MENIFWNYRKVRIFRKLKYACYPCTTVLCWIVWVCSNALSLSKRTTFDCVFPKGCVRTLLAPMQALSIVSMLPKPFRCMPRFPLITRVSYATTVCVLLPPDNQQSPCNATPLWKQKFDIGCTIYRRVVIPHPAVLEDKKSASKAPFCLIFWN